MVRTADLRGRRGDHGQAVVVVALVLALLMGFSGLAVDGARYYAERRFLQNAADAAALACVQKLNAGGTAADAEGAARTLLNAFNLARSPTGTTVGVATLPVYTGWFNGDATGADKRNLADGIVVGTSNCRVALRAGVRLLFIPIVNPALTSLEVPANAHARVRGGQLPVIVNRFDNPPGPGGSFHDYARQEAFDMNCDDNDADGDEGTCPWATQASPGRERVIVGNGYTSSESNFRGFVALDVRDFSTLDGGGNPVHQYYNGTTGMNSNALKDKEAKYFTSPAGYPGPDLAAYDPLANPPQPGLQLAILSGGSTGLAVDEMKKAFRAGDRVVAQLFDGQVQEVPDFTLNPPSSVEVTSPQANGNGPSFRVGANQNFRAANNLVTLRMVRDTFNGSANDTPAGLHGPTTQSAQFRFDPGTTDPALGGCPNAGPPGFSGGCFTPPGGSGTEVRIKDLQVDAGVPSGIYSLIIRGTGYTPTGASLSTKQVWVALEAGSVTRDFEMEFSSTSVDVALNGTATFSFELETDSGIEAWGGTSPTNNVSVAIDYNGCVAGTEVELRSATGTVFCRTGVTISPTSALPSKTSPPIVTVTVPTSGLAAGSYSFVLRARGTNQDGQPVVHVQPLTVNIDSTGGSEKKYVNVQGYAVFQVVTCTITNSSNAVCGRAVSGKANNSDDPALRVGRRGGLAPWESAPFN